MSYKEEVSSGLRRFINKVGWLPADIVAVIAYVLFAELIFIGIGRGTIPAVLVGLPLVLFLPGYVLMGVLFPGQTVGHPSRLPLIGSGGRGPFERITGFQRAALSFGMSVAVIPLLTLLIHLAQLPYTSSTLTGAFMAFILIGSLLAIARRLQVPPENRFYVPFRRWFYGITTFLGGGQSHVDTVLRTMFVICIVLGVGSLSYAVAVPPSGSEYSDYMLLTENEAGDFVASGYPSEFTSGEGQDLVVGIQNNRDRPETYSVVIEVQRVRGEGSELTIVERNELDRVHSLVEGGDTWYHPHVVAPETTGEDLRLVYYFYRGERPDEVSDETADDHLHIWIDVTLPS